MKRLLIAAMCGVALSGCIATRERALAPNVVRLDTEARGWLFMSQAQRATMRQAAETTLRKGYTHFRIYEEPGVAGALPPPAPDSKAPSKLVGATVVMFRANEAGAREAYDAAEVIKNDKAN